ncbi:MAG: SRPBCC family protein [Reichenbachiella sp.]
MAGTKEKKKYKEIVVSEQGEAINVSAEKLWEIVGTGFAYAGEWSTAVDHSVGKGKGEFEGATCSNRTCDLNAKGFDKISEELTHYDVKNQELVYDVTEGLPGFVTKASSYWQVIDLGDGTSTLKMTTTMHTKKFMGALMGGMMKKNIKSVLPTVSRDLKVYAETGNISQEKKERMAKLAS